MRSEATPRNATYVHVDVDFCGKLHRNANYVQGCSVEEAYLRWVPMCGAKENKKRRASIHMVLGLAEGSPLPADAGDRFPAAAERVTFWSGGAWAEHCPLCARLLEPDAREELLSYHRRETPPAEAEAPEPSQASCRRRNRRPAAGAAAPAPAATSRPSAGPPAPPATGAAVAHAADAASSDEEGCARGGPEFCQPPLCGTGGMQEESCARGGPEPRRPPPCGAAVDDRGCRPRSLSLDEAPPPRTPVSLAMRAGPPATPCSTIADGSPRGALGPLELSFESVGVRSLAFETPLRSARQSAPTIDEEGPAGGSREGCGRGEPEVPAAASAPAPAPQLDALSRIVHDLALAVRETSASVADLRQTVASDHALLQQHLQEAREDRRVMLGLLRALAQERGLEPREG